MVKAGENEKFIKKYEESGDKKAKGAKKNVIRREISHSDYRDVILNNKMMHHQMRSIRSEKHQISSYHLMIKDIYFMMVSVVMLTVIRKFPQKLMDYCNYMTPEKVARKIMELGDSITDNSVVENCTKDFKTSPNKGEIVRRYERAGNIKLSKEDSKTVKLRLQKKLNPVKNLILAHIIVC